MKFLMSESINHHQKLPVITCVTVPRLTRLVFPLTYSSREIVFRASKVDDAHASRVKELTAVDTCRPYYTHMPQAHIYARSRAHGAYVGQSTEKLQNTQQHFEFRA